MIIPSIDIMNGHAVQLVGGVPEKLEVDAGDPRPLAEAFGRIGEIAVIDLDAAMGRGSNADVISELLEIAPCRVGGGIRDVDSAISWLDRGARKVILGTAARPEILSALPAERVIAALDAKDEEIVVEGWTQRTGTRVFDRVAELAPLVGGFLITAVEREGRLGGVDLDRTRRLVEAAGDARVTIAGGIADAAEVAAVDALGADAQVGMALYTGRFDLADALSAMLRSDRTDGLWPTVVTDVYGRALGLCYSNAESLRAALAEGRGIYWSRKRGLWRKGETSGAAQRLIAADMDCDRDTLRFVVEQAAPGFCHQNTWSCWGELGGWPGLDRTLAARRAAAPAGSYTHRLFTEPGLLEAKLREEADELGEASDPDHVVEEAADLLYFASVALTRAGRTPADVEAALDRRALKVKRRRGDAKTKYTER